MPPYVPVDEAGSENDLFRIVHLIKMFHRKKKFANSLKVKWNVMGIGKSIQRVDARAKVTGQEIYTGSDDTADDGGEGGTQYHCQWSCDWI